MKQLLFILLLSSFAYGKTYYPASIAEANSLTLSAGDSVILSGTLYGSLNTKAGVYYGGNATITGFKTVTGWTSLGGNIYESVESFPADKVTMVLVNGIQQAMGRYPNGKDNWIYATAVSSSTPPIKVSFTNTTLPANFSGGHVVMRKMHWVVDHNLIQSNTANSLTYSALPGSTTRMPFQVKYGFFIENHPATLDQNGEWYYTPAKKIRVYMTSIQPVKVGTVQNIVNAVAGVTLENLTLEGSIEQLVNVQGDGVTVKNCTLQYAGRSAVMVDFNIRHRLTVLNNTIRYVNDMGIYTDYRGGDYVTIRNNQLSDIGMIPGTGGWGDFGQTAIHTSGSYALIEGNTVKRIGYTGIKFGDKTNNMIRYNLIDSVCLTKDDGSGIYTYRGSSTYPSSGNVVKNNIILNCIGNPYGTSVSQEARHDAYGIYMDQNATGVTIENNTVSGAKFGIFNNQSTGIAYINNTILNCLVAQNTWRANAGQNTITGMKFIGNIYVGMRDKFRNTVQWWETTGSNSIPNWGISDYNYFVSAWGNTINGSAPSFSNWSNFTLSGWKSSSVYGRKDQNSKYIQTTAVQRLEYNPTMIPKTVFLSRRYKDLSGNIYSTSVTLQPFTSIILIEN